MKKNIKFWVFGVLLICLILCLLMIKNVNNKMVEETCDNFELSELINEIMLSTDNNFMQDIDDNISLFIPITISKNTNYVFLRDEISGEYFVIGKDLNEKELLDLNSFVENNNKLYVDKKIVSGTYGKLTYAIFSQKYSSVIEGIIRSYVYCN